MEASCRTPCLGDGNISRAARRDDTVEDVGLAGTPQAAFGGQYYRGAGPNRLAGAGPTEGRVCRQKGKTRGKTVRSPGGRPRILGPGWEDSLKKPEFRVLRRSSGRARSRKGAGLGGSGRGWAAGWLARRDWGGWLGGHPCSRQPRMARQRGPGLLMVLQRPDLRKCRFALARRAGEIIPRSAPITRS